MPKPQMRYSLGLLAVAPFLFAAEPLGTILSTEPFELRGARVPAAGVPSWPITAGDEIVTTTATAELRFRDGSRIILDRGAKAVLESNGGVPALRLLKGIASYSLTPQSKFALYEGSKPVATGRKRAGVFGRTTAGVPPTADMAPRGPVRYSALTPVSGSAPPGAPPPPGGGAPPPPGPSGPRTPQ